MGKHISDTRTMCWEMYYAHPKSGRKLFVDTRRQASAVWNGKNLRKNTRS